MSDHVLPRVARRILNRPQLISERGALAVLGALAPRLGIGRVYDAHGVALEIPLSTASGELVEPDDRDRPAGRIFDFYPDTGIAYIPIEGELVHRFGHLEPTSGMTGYDAIKHKVQDAAEDAEVKGIMLDIDSPGGEVFGVDGTAEAIFQAREAKPIWALVNEQATSAAYWLASAAHLVIGPVTSESGSIGVVRLHVDMSGALDKEGLFVTIIHAGAHKAEGNPFEPLPDDVREAVQLEVNTVHEMFAGVVARNRGLSIEAVMATEAGVFMGPDAMAVGLIDAVASEDEAFRGFAERLARPESVALIQGA